MADMNDPDYKEYQEYLEYQKHLANNNAIAAPGADYAPEQTISERFSDPNRWKALLGMDSPAKREVVGGAAPLAIPAAAAPSTLVKLSEFLGKTTPRRILAAAGQGAAMNPEHPVKGALISAGIATGGEGVSKLLNKSADVGMQAAVGRRKYTPGVGNTLADEGIIGTKGMMKDQVNRRLAERGQQIHDIAQQIPETTKINSPQIASEVMETQLKPMTSNGIAPAKVDEPKIQKVLEMAGDIESRGPETATQALGRRIAAGTRSYRGKEDALQNLMGQASKQEQQLYSAALKDAANQTSPELGAQLQQADKSYGALKRAQSALDEEANIPQSLFGLLSLGPKTIPGAPAAVSGLSQLLSKGSKAAEAVSSPLARDRLLNRK